MREKIENSLIIEVDGAELTGWSAPELYIRQGRVFLQYTPRLVDETHLAVTIPLEDAMRLEPGSARLQLAYTDVQGKPCASEPEPVPVGALLKEAGYHGA